MPILEISRKEVTEQPILFVRSRITRSEIARAIGEGLGAAFGLAQRKGCAIAGPPWESYLTDPEATPNPADWRTAVYWPLAS